MGTNFSGINTALRALQTQQRSLDITGHNIANANNEEYSRQRAVHSATDPFPYPGMNMPNIAGQVGTGVEISEIQRIRDDFIDQQIRGESQDLGKWNKIYEGINRIELTFNEPSESGLSQSLDDFWQSLQDLSNYPEDEAARSTVQQRGQALVDTFNSLNSQLTDYKRSLNDDVNSVVDEINSLSTRIADLNNQISRIEATGNKANDLLDRRNALFNQLNEKIDVSGHIDDRNRLNISLGGTNLVSGNRVEELAIEPARTQEDLYQDKIVFATNGKEADIGKGELAGILEIRDNAINQYQVHLDKIAFNLAHRFNEVHKSGYDAEGNKGENFFNIGDKITGAAGEIELTYDIRNDINKIAAGNYSDNPQAVTASLIDGEGYGNYEIIISEYEILANGTYLAEEVDHFYNFEGNYTLRDFSNDNLNETVFADQEKTFDIIDISETHQDYNYALQLEGQDDIYAVSEDGQNWEILEDTITDIEYDTEFIIDQDIEIGFEGIITNGKVNYDGENTLFAIETTGIDEDELTGASWILDNEGNAIISIFNDQNQNIMDLDFSGEDIETPVSGETISFNPAGNDFPFTVSITDLDREEEDIDLTDLANFENLEDVREAYFKETADYNIEGEYEVVEENNQIWLSLDGKQLARVEYDGENNISTAYFDNQYNHLIDSEVDTIYQVEFDGQLQTGDILTIEEQIDFEYTIREIETDQEYSGTAIKGETINLAIEEDLNFSDIFEFEIHQSGEAKINFAGNPGSGANSTALSRVLHENDLIDYNASIMGSFESLISSLGVVGQRAEQMVDNQEALVNQLKNQQQSISGVSLDEEMANMIKYQHAYNAAARIISSTDRMLDSLLAIVR